MSELKDRVKSAIVSLEQKKRKALAISRPRIEGKIEGVKLVLSYIEEEEKAGTHNSVPQYLGENEHKLVLTGDSITIKLPEGAEEITVGHEDGKVETIKAYYPEREWTPRRPGRYKIIWYDYRGAILGSKHYRAVTVRL